MLNITKNPDGKELTLVLEGRLDTTTAPELGAEIKEDIDFRNWKTNRR